MDIPRIKSKKAILPALILPIVIGIILIVALIAFLFSGTIRYTIIGMGIIAAAVFGLGPGMMSGNLDNRKLGLFFGIIFIGVLFIFVPRLDGILQSTISPPSGQYIQVPTFMWYECAPGTDLINSPESAIPTDGAWYECPADSNGCNIWVLGEKNTILDRRFRYQICTKGSSNCFAESYESVNDHWKLWGNGNDRPSKQIATLTNSQRIYITYQRQSFGWWNREGASVFYQYNPFILWKNDVFNGGRTEYSTIEQGCTFTNSDRLKLVDSVTNVISGKVPAQSSTDDYKLAPYKTRNFISNYVPISVENVNFVSYNGQPGYCINRQVFAISDVNTNSGTYKIVDSSFNTRLAPSVTCCPGETEPTRKCNSKFEWENIDGGQCSAFRACAGADWYPSGSAKQLIRYNCVQGYCKPETMQVECTTNADCLTNPNGNICDTKIWKCVNVPPPKPCTKDSDCLAGETCNSGVCKGGKEACDAKQGGLLGWQWVESSSCGFWCKIGLSGETTTGQCKPTFLIYYVLAGVAIVFMVFIIIMFKAPARQTSGKRKR